MRLGLSDDSPKSSWSSVFPMISMGLSMTFLIFPYEFMAFSWHFHGISDARSTGSSLGRHVHGHVFAAVLPAEPVAGGAAGSASKLGENPKRLRNPAPIWDGWKPMNRIEIYWIIACLPPCSTGDLDFATIHSMFEQGKTYVPSSWLIVHMNNSECLNVNIGLAVNHEYELNMENMIS